MTAGEDAMAVIQGGADPGYAQPVEPGGAEFGFKVSAEVSFGLRIDVNAASDAHARGFRFGLRVAHD